MIIYLDESGDLGFNFNNPKTTRYLVIGLLVFFDDAAHLGMLRAVKKMLRNKLPKNLPELKGSNLTLPVKKYFLKELNEHKNWCLYTAAADKKAWVKHHVSNNYKMPEKKALYDEIAKRLFSQLNHLKTSPYVNVIVDRSKNNDDIKLFDQIVMAEIKKQISEKTLLTIRHCSSQGDAGLQAVDIFCSGVGRKYEFSDLTWYCEFSDRIAAEVEYKF